jgi:hypothetical protein
MNNNAATTTVTCPRCPMKWCERCGGPQAEMRSLSVAGCRLCWLDVWTSQEVRYDDEEERGYSAEGEALSAVEAWMARDALADGTLTVERCNSPCPHASGWWLPEGAREALHPSLRLRLPDEALLSQWLANYAPVDVLKHVLEIHSNRIGVIAGGYRIR